ncbi:MAG TPA: hypothetical protein VLE99_02195 [Candidatus Saccharimonadales bacterium]|nr:hypothetical protein [Candidatus Saccharimonadales bacterium]
MGRIVGEITHDGITLPVYSSAGIVMRPPRPTDGPNAVKFYKDRERFERYVRIAHILRGIPLVGMVEAADAVFAGAASLVGATVVDHHWGFARLTNADGISECAHAALPDGYGLIADVAIIPGAQRLNAATEAEVGRALQGQRYRTVHGVFSWIDFGGSQFLDGADGDRYLHDLDLRIMLQRQQT